MIIVKKGEKVRRVLAIKNPETGEPFTGAIYENEKFTSGNEDIFICSRVDDNTVEIEGTGHGFAPITAEADVNWIGITDERVSGYKSHTETVQSIDETIGNLDLVEQP